MVARTTTSALEPGLVGAIRAALAGAGDPVRAAGQQAYMKSSMPYRGLTSPELRALLRPLLADPALAPASRAAWEADVRGLWDGAAFREERYAALAVTATGRPGRGRTRRPSGCTATSSRPVRGGTTSTWWPPTGSARSCCGTGRSCHPIMRADAVDDHLWVRRTAILAQLKHREETDLDLLADVIDANLEGSRYGHEFFIRKAIGWALRQHARVDPRVGSGLRRGAR